MIKEAQWKKVEIKIYGLTFLEEKLVQEATTGFQYAEVVDLLEEEIRPLNTEDSMNCQDQARKEALRKN